MKGNANAKITFWEIIKTLAFAMLLSIIVLQFFRFNTVVGHSMDSTLYDGQRLILNLQAYSKKEPEYKDIIVVKRDDLSVKYLIKRVIGVPGDTIEIKDNQLYINGTLTNEDYINEPMETEDLYIEVPAGKVFIMGDNRNHSLDSRNINVIGLIDCDEILGKAVFSFSTFEVID